MKYIAIVSLLLASASWTRSGNALRVFNNKLSADESQAAEADIDALMDKYDAKEKQDKDTKLMKKNPAAHVDPN